MRPTPPLPLDGTRIIALEQFAAGPFGTLHLADLGAEIIKIEDPSVGGDVGRYVPPYTEGEDSLYFEALNRGKKSVALDLSIPEGRRAFEALVTASDAVYSNVRGDVPAKLRITYDDLKHLNPAIVCCALTGYGTTGPRSNEPGYDYMLQARAGWMDITGEPDGPPTKSGLSLVDFTAGYVAALALVCGIMAARRDGTGMDCDVSLFDTAISMLTYPGAWHLNQGYVPRRVRRSAHPSLVPFQAFEAADGWIVVGCAKEKFWRRLTTVVNRPDLASDPRFQTFAERQRHATDLLAILEPLFKAETVATWSKRCRELAVPFGEVNSVAQALQDPQVEARELIVTAAHPRFGPVQTLASPVRVGSTRAPAYRAPQRGEDTFEILTEVARLSHEEVAHLAASGALGDRQHIRPDDR